MELKDKIYLASKAFKKKWDFETLKYGDDLYGKEYLAEEIWEIVEEIEKEGTNNWYKRHQDYKLYL